MAARPCWSTVFLRPSGSNCGPWASKLPVLLLPFRCFADGFDDDDGGDDDDEAAFTVLGIGVLFFGLLTVTFLGELETTVSGAMESSAPPSIAGRTSGASSRSACPVFLMALASPISYHIPDFPSFFKNLPAGCMDLISLTMAAAM